MNNCKLCGNNLIQKVCNNCKKKYDDYGNITNNYYPFSPLNILSESSSFDSSSDSSTSFDSISSNDSGSSFESGGGDSGGGGCSGDW